MFAHTLSLSSDFKALVLTVTQLSVKTPSAASHPSAHMMLHLLSLFFSSLLHGGSSKLFPNFTMASLPHCFHLGKTHSVNCQGGLVPAPICPQAPAPARHSQQPQFDTWVFLPSAVFHCNRTSSSQFWFLLFCLWLLPQPLLLLLSQ